MAAITCEEIQEQLRGVQDHIANWLITTSGGQKYHEDVWEYKKGSGGGRSRVWEGQEGSIIEKAGVNFSAIHGSQLPKASVGSPLSGIPAGVSFTATGVSLVIHPRSPFIPTIHMNVRFFEAGDVFWFGGGIDLTPYYPVFEQVQGFHKGLATVCKAHNQPYSEYKAICDDYFTLKHRGEMRGVGGIFFDQLKQTSENGFTKQSLLSFIISLGLSFTDLYAPFFENVHLPYSAAQREYQLWRRSRYVEFNLLWDRGTKFGIESEGRAESILMSLPTVAKWHYDFHPTQGTIESIVQTFYLHPQDWVNLRIDQVPTPTSSSNDFSQFAPAPLPPSNLTKASLVLAGFALGFVAAAATFNYLPKLKSAKK